MGKQTPFSVAVAFDRLYKACRADVAVARWVLDCVQDAVDQEVMHHSELKGTSFYGHGSNKAIIDVMAMKYWILRHFLSNVLSDAGMPGDDLKVMRDMCASHQTYRAHCGGKETVDLSWQGIRGEGFVKACTFVAVVIYGKEIDGTIKAMLKSTSTPEGVFENSQFVQMVQMVRECYVKVSKAEPEAQEIDDGDVDRLTPLLTAEQKEFMKNVSADDKEKVQQYIESARAHVKRFIQLRVEGRTVNEVADSLENSVLQDQSSSQPVIVYLDSKCCGEASSQPHVRFPTFSKDRMKKLIQGFLKARNQSEPSNEVLVMALDGKRDLLSMMAACMVNTDGDLWQEKSRATFTIVYDEDSVAAQKVRTRSLINLTELLHVWSTTSLEKHVDKRNRKHYRGSTFSTVIGPVAVPPVEERWRLPKDAKTNLLGPLGKSLVGGKVEADPAPEFADGLIPVSWHSMEGRFYEELLHSFKAKKILDLSCLDECLGLKQGWEKVNEQNLA